MSIRNINNRKMTIEKQYCNNFVTLYKELKEYTKLLKNKEITNIEYNIKIEFR